MEVQALVERLKGLPVKDKWLPTIHKTQPAQAGKHEHPGPIAKNTIALL